MRTERGDQTSANRTGQAQRRTRAGMGGLFLLLVLASFAVFTVACGGDPTATPQPTATTAPAPTATTPQPTATTPPEQTATTAPEPTATAAPEPTPTAVPAPTATRAPDPTPTPAPEPEYTDNDLTMAYVMQAIDFYEENGLDATAGRYNDAASMEGERALFLIAQDDLDVLAAPLEGLLLGPAIGTLYEPLIRQTSELAAEEGAWYEIQGINAVTGLAELQRAFIIERDGLVFWAAHSILLENVEATTQEYVSKAIARYDAEGLEATIAYHNSPQSLDGQFYLFLIGADDIYLAHPVFAHLIGTDIKDVVGSDGYELGKDIAQATEEGIWVEYLWPHPVTRREQQKVTWAVRHDGLIFASGYYAGESEVGSREWLEADPREYTMGFVRRAIERYDNDGLDSMLDYYNSVASFEGQWYLFATDENDIYNVHPLLPHLRGTDIKDVVGSDGYELGKALAQATEEGIWVEYLWPHPVTLQETPKISYAVRHDGILFASGYYEGPANAAARTQEYVRKAIDFYRENSREATAAHYNSPESFDGQWRLTIADESGIFIVIPFLPQLMGTSIEDFKSLDGQEVGKEVAENASEDGSWVSFVVPVPSASEIVYAHSWAVRYDGLLFISSYFDDRPEVPSEAMTDDQRTMAYVQQAIAYYDRNGLDAAVEFYKTAASAEDGRSLTLMDADESVLLVYRTIPSLEGQYVGPGSSFSGLGELIGAATEEGFWVTARAINPATKQEEPRRILAVLHDGLVFVSSHSALTEDVENSTKEYVNKAIAKYEEDGLAATIAYYNSQDSLDGQFYLFFIGEDDNYLAHPIFPHLIGTDIKDVVGSDGQELGREIAEATEEGIWVEYLWPHPVSRKEQQKVTWAVRHDGLIFASGYYAGGPETGAPPWQGADPKEYTVEYVERAIERYRRDGLESMLNYYNSVASFEGEWYLFATDEDDVYHVHPLLSRLIGTDIKDVVGSDGYELGKELAAAEDGGEGVWVEYLWPHPVTLKEVPKVGYAVRHDGMLFASGYYPKSDNPAAETKAYVQKAIQYYQANGLEATIARYNSRDSVDGQWSLTLADGKDIVLTAILSPNLIGTDLKDVGAGLSRQVGEEMAAATEQGIWVSFVFPNTRSSETLYAHTWAIRHDGLLFTSRYYDDQPGDPAEPAEPAAAPDADALTRAYVQKAIAYYEANGREATIEYYSLITEDRAVPSLGPDRRYLFLVDPETYVLLASPIHYLNNQVMGLIAPGGPFHAEVAKADENGIWVQSLRPNPATGQQEPARYFIVLHDGLLFMSAHQIIQQNVEAATKEYVNKAIGFYRQYGLLATESYYNSPASVEGQFYLFMTDENDIYIVHPIEPERIGTDIKEVTDSAGDPLGQRIAQATEEGVWVEYFWPHPVTGKKELKTTWAIRPSSGPARGKIFASGYYTDSPAWVGEDPWEFTQDYVGRAIERYNDDGLESMRNYYNSVVSFEGQWYLFATDENDSYIVHPVFPNLVGTDIKALTGKDSEGNPLGESLAKAADGGKGIRVEYQWPHPITLVEAPKIAYAVRRNGILFASGYYPLPEDPRTYTQDYVAEAIAYYEKHGLAATVDYYRTKESVAEGVWFLALLDKDGKFLTHYVNDGLIGTDAEDYQSPDGTYVGRRMLEATEEGHWFQATFPNVRGAGDNYRITWAIRHDGLIFTSGYFGAPTVEQGQPDPAEPAAPDGGAMTRAYVRKAIDFYEANGLDAAVARYNDVKSVEGERSLMILRGDDQTVLASAIYDQLVGSNSFTGPGTPLGTSISKATSEGYWISDIILVNPATGQQGRTRFLVVRHDGLIFGAPHFIVRKEYAKDYVRRAIALYEREGLDAAIAFYDGPASLDGEFYLFLIGADDIYLAHPILPHLKGTDIKAVTDSSGYALGVEIAKATEEGHWVEYLWPNPVTRIEEPKSAWVVRHDGLIFATGYYTPDPDAEPAWKDADPREYTVTYVEEAIARYDRDGLEALQSYYNSVGSFEGQWYLFATDANDHYVLHPLFSHLIGTDIKNLATKDSEGNPLGESLAAARDGEEGVWVEYLWPHPFTLQEVPKVAYAVRHKGLLFASGYYPEVEDPRAYTEQFVADAVARYKRDGREAAIAYYNSPESIDGQWLLLMVNEQDGTILAYALNPQSVGTVIPGVGQLGITEEGTWFPPYAADNPLAPEKNRKQDWYVLHDGVIFASGYHFSDAGSP